jgi:GT2 family glycosyltransferase
MDSRGPGPPAGREDPAATQAELVAARARIRELERTVASLASGIDEIEGDLTRIAASRAWRLGHRLTELGWRILRRPIRTQGGPARALERVARIRLANAGLPAGPLPPLTVDPPAVRARFDPAAVARAEGPRREALAAELRGRLGPAPERDDWPSVSAIVVSHDGHDRLARLLAGLARATDYPELELIVVDNGSTEPLAAAGGDTRWPAAVLRLDRNETFSDANNLAAQRAGGDLMLLLNDDVEPFESGWLREMVAIALQDGVGAVGATLLHVAHDPSMTPSGWIVQHRGVRFRLEDQLPRAFNDGDGDDPLGPGFGVQEPFPAVTAAALLLRRDVFTAAGGFDPGYRYGTEDVDLCLKLLDAGREVISCGRAFLFHRESSTQATVSRVAISENRRVNRRLLHERWGPRLRRELRRGRVAGDGYWTPERAHIGITVSSLDPADGWGDWYTAHELGAALRELGLRVTMLPRKGADLHAPPDDLDVVVALMDGFDLGPVHPSVPVFAWVRNWTHRWTTRPWFWRVDAWLTSSAGSEAVLRELVGVPSVRFPLATNPQLFGDPGAPRVYDYVLTSNRWGVEREIERLIEPRQDERVALFGRGWEEVPALADHWRGPVPYERLPRIYGSARIVLDDTAGPTLPYGALNGRVFDALAAGALVLTNCEAGVLELFDDDFPVWSDAERLRSELDRLLADEPLRAGLAARYRATVLAEHTYARRAGRLSELMAEADDTISFVIRIGAPDWDRAQRWGDLHFARAVERELKRRGHRCLVQVLPEWEDLDGCTYDVSLVLRGRSAHRPKAGQLNVLWSISHPEELHAAECDGYDLVAVASPAYAEIVARRTSTPVFVLEQATDPWRFYADPDPELAHELVFVGNSRRARRPALDWLLPTEHDLAVWGGDWEGLIDTRHVVDEFIANDELRRVYSSAAIVLADHWPDMREHGYISNRIFDALACGATVLSDSVSGLAERFDGAVSVFEDPEGLREQVERLLSDPDQRRERARLGRDLVSREHTFAHRVDELLSHVTARRTELGCRDGIGARDRPGAGR